MEQQYLAAIRRPNRPTIQGVQVRDLEVHADNRGWLSELLRADAPHYAGFGQLYVVRNFQQGSIRAFHKHLQQDEWFFVLHGAIQFILVDERDGNPTYKQLNCFVFTADRPRALYVPRGIQHGSMALTAGAEILAVTNAPYNAASPDEVRVPWDTYGDIWQVGCW